MNSPAPKRAIFREKLSRYGALAWLLGLGGLALAGPYGLLSWSENRAMLEQREQRIAALVAQRDELKNRVVRLDPDHADPDLATELIRRDLNVAHPDEYVLDLKPRP
ncbi:MAG: septum formation initiator [Sphingomonadales bacterium 32-68-7]|nr:MAG: septum formation initiator [Sphingomonadales bacterium 12-68-11]OYX08609.1 MAG: septum formation initiator [Sphingomonadales bacterium 32-68-7]